MRPRSVQTTTSPGRKKSRSSYGENSPVQPAKEKSKVPVRQAAEESQRSAQGVSARKTNIAEKIAQLAYSIWEREGRPDGRQEEFWLRAEAELKQNQGARA